MNKGTIIRTILVIATCLNTALLATDVAQFGNETVNLIYRILSVAANFVIVFCATWFNNDYTEAACIGTGVTRQIKAEMKEDYNGDYFFAEGDDFDEVEEEEDNE
jgi:SPP1 family holin